MLVPPSSTKASPKSAKEKKASEERIVVIAAIILFFTLLWVCAPTPYEFNATRVSAAKRQLIQDAQLDLALNDILEYNVARRQMRRTNTVDIPEPLWNEWVPDPSRFENVEQVLQMTGTNGTVIEELFYLATPQIIDIQQNGQLKIKWNSKLMIYFLTVPIGECWMYGRCHKHHYFVRNGNLYVHSVFDWNQQTLEMTRVYYVPAKNLLDHFFNGYH
ncbi:hypothetical protein GCK72_021942 [Caenorhabditis remanei]|uniref:Uncharacterized protein n=1 Tax=Caenorhabditis remanei TaxID=31234 RepID=A0A6A5GL49_CAERE|nr:hypothetical protein GCK72_021942 [Caenorhabditis remanei]KAF1755373.1 hypothetical protein GCK72_021942 [Caenorhabditis remanei]